MSQLVRHIISIWHSLTEAMVTNLPGPAGREVRRRYWRGRLGYMGPGVQIDAGVRILNPAYVFLEGNVWIDNYVVLIAGPPGTSNGPVYHRPNLDCTAALGEIRIGKNVHLANFAVLQGHGGLSIEGDTTVASGCKIYSMSHHHSNLVDHSDRKKYKFTSLAPRHDQSLIVGPVVVKTQAALGLNSIVLPGVCIGAGSWVGAGSVITHSLPDNVLASGNPAQVLKTDLHPGWSPDRGAQD